MKSGKNCPFCVLNQDEEQKIIFENETCRYIQKKKEQTILEGSGLIIPKNHVQTVFDLSEQEWKDTRDLMQKAKRLLDEAYAPDGYSVGWNTGEVGGQSIPHAHLHIIPRFTDEPYAGKGIRHWIKQPENKRPKK
ncbi:HIT family protein [Virgibacillus necropolis]|uniref:HIT family protein n=1 Tax=Virgibacillus necropolis TaxID=163877 RepID=A0A221MGK8_9BACI|nr:HIT family protein [Virgibacillus necropolis]ASN06786.1 HIT family protein [Virgibacillus necropolis]